MKPAPFIYERPSSLAATLELLAPGNSETKILAGGQSLIAMMNFRLAKPERLIDINKLPDLDYVRKEGNEIAIGALARHYDVKNSAVVRRLLSVPCRMALLGTSTMNFDKPCRWCSM